MEKVKDIGKVDGKYRAEFLCPICQSVVIKPSYDGKHANTCGSQNCKIKFNTSPRKSKLPYYSALAMQYKDIKNKYTVCEDWSSFARFFDDIYILYCDARKVSGKINITFNGQTASIQALVLTPVVGDTRISHSKIVGEDLTDDSYKLTSQHIAELVGTAHSNVKRRISKLISETDFGAVTACTVLSNGTRRKKVVASKLTPAQYNTLKISMEATSPKNKPSHVYILKGGGLVKIGISFDVKNRYKKLCTSSPVPLELIYNVDIIDARKIEKELHSKYKDYNSHGEWFNLTDTQVKEIITYLDSIK